MDLLFRFRNSGQHIEIDELIVGYADSMITHVTGVYRLLHILFLLLQLIAAKHRGRYRVGHILYYPYSKVHGANMGPIWGRQDPGGPHVGLMHFAL